MFFKGSRYQQVETLLWTAPDGRVISYKARRILPRPPAQVGHVVDEGERPDHVAHDQYRDPERFWHIADANTVIDPRELTDTPGRLIAIPPAGG